MPQAIPFIIDWSVDAVVAAGNFLGLPASVTIATAQVVAAAAPLVAVTAVSLAANALLAPPTPTPEAQRSTIRQTLPPRFRGCGHTRMGGALLVDYATGQNLNQVIAFLDCRGGNVDRYWLTQDEVTLTGNQVNTLANGAYSRVQLYITNGVTGTGAFPELTALYPAIWPATCYGTGVFMGHMMASNGKIEDFVKDYPRGPQIQFNVAADIDVHYDWRAGGQSRTDPTTWTNSSNPVVGLVNELWRYRAYDWDLDFAPTLSILTTEANVCDEAVPILNILAEISLDANVGDHAIRLKSIDGLSVGMTIIVAGQSFTVSSFGATHADGDDVNISGGLSASVAAGAMVRWLSNPLAPATRPRWSADGRWAAGEAEADTVDRLLKSMDGFMFRRGSDGAVVIMAGHYVAPTYVIGLDEIVDYDWPGFIDAGKIINQLVPSYVEPANDYNQVDTTPWDDDASIDIDGLNSQAFAPGLVQLNGQVRRLAKANMARQQAPQRSITLKASGLYRLGERFLQLAAGGLEVDEMNGAILEVTGNPEIIDNGLGVRFPVKLFEPACYDWNYETEEGEGPADVAAPVSEVLADPVITATDVIFDAVTNGVAGVRIEVTAAGPTRDDLTWSVRWRKTGTTSWSEATDSSLTGSPITITTGFVPAEVNVDVEVEYQTGAGTPSNWSATTVVNTATDTTPPDDLTFITLTGWGNSINLLTDNSPRARSYIWRFYEADGVTLVDTKTTVQNSIIYTATEAALSPGGVQRDYVVTCQSANSAGDGAAATATISKPALPLVTGVSATGGSVGEIQFTTQPAAVSYLIVYSTTTGFNPDTQGAPILAGGSPAFLFGLSANTYFALVAAYDEWTDDAMLLNFSAQVSFTITSASPTPPPAGGGIGGGAGGTGAGGGATSLF